MNKFIENVSKQFSFLERYGYFCKFDMSEKSIRFIGRNNEIWILFSDFEFELDCWFYKNDRKKFSLQDGIDYMQMSDYKGRYQIANELEIEQGIQYLSQVLKKFLEQIDVSEMLNFDRIFQYTISLNTQLKVEYHYKNDIKKADEYWKKADYLKAYELYRKYDNKLTNVQRKKLEYCEKYGNDIVCLEKTGIFADLSKKISGNNLG